MTQTHGRGGTSFPFHSPPPSATKTFAHCPKCLHYMMLDCVTLKLFCPSCGGDD